MIGVLISALVLMGAMWIVARHEADFDLKKILVIALVVSVASFAGALSGFIQFLIPVILIGLGWALHHFCYISILQSAIVCGIWLVVQVGLSILIS